jgi:hypothetical protein
MHLIVRPETAKANSETTDVYLAPDDYLKDFGCHYAKGDRIQVKGSKVNTTVEPRCLPARCGWKPPPSTCATNTGCRIGNPDRRKSF